LSRDKYVTVAAALLALLAVGRVIRTYPFTAQAFDEPTRLIRTILRWRVLQSAFRSTLLVNGTRNCRLRTRIGKLTTMWETRFFTGTDTISAT